MSNPIERAALEAAEAALGENLVWLSDALDLRVRQRDTETIRRLAQLEAAWTQAARALAGKPHAHG